MPIPGLYAVVARRQTRAGGHDPHFELAGKPTFPLRVEATAKRPTVKWSGGAGLGEWGHVPLADHIVAPAMEAQDLGDCAGVASDLAAITRITAVEVGEAANAHRVRIATRQHGGARRG